MATNPVSSALGGTPAPATSSSTAPMLGKDDFLKLLTAQMANQNPLAPTDDQQMMTQMTAFSTLEQITNVAATSQTSAAVNAFNQAIALIGHDVDFLGADGTIKSGKVERVTTTGGTPSLTIGGTPDIAPAKVTQIR